MQYILYASYVVCCDSKTVSTGLWVVVCVRGEGLWEDFAVGVRARFRVRLSDEGPTQNVDDETNTPENMSNTVAEQLRQLQQKCVRDSTDKPFGRVTHPSPNTDEAQHEQCRNGVTA